MKKSSLIWLLLLTDLMALALFSAALLMNPESGDLLSNPLFYVAIGLFFLAPVVWVVLYLANPERSDAQVLRTGRQAYATVLEVSEDPKRSLTAGGWAGLKLQVNPPDEPPYETSAQVAVSGVQPAPYRPGMALKVRYDPKHPKRVVVEPGSGPNTLEQGGEGPDLAGAPAGGPLVWSESTSFSTGSTVSIEGLSPVLQGLVQKALVDGDHNGIPDLMERGGLGADGVSVIDLRGRTGQPVDPKRALEKLDKLREMGLLTQQQFETLRARLESDPPPGAAGSEP